MRFDFTLHLENRQGARDARKCSQHASFGGRISQVASTAVFIFKWEVSVPIYLVVNSGMEWVDALCLRRRPPIQLYRSCLFHSQIYTAVSIRRLPEPR